MNNKRAFTKIQPQVELRMWAFALLGLILLSAVCPVFASDAANQLNRILADTRTLAADFRQVSINEAGQPGKISRGIFLLAKPGKFRWDYHQPYKQEIVANGKKVWFYDADLEQVTVKQLGNAIGSTPALLLTGQVKLDENFLIEDQGVREGMRWIRLIPRSEDNSFKYISIGIQGDNLQGMELNDNFGQLTRISFSNIKINNSVEPGRFEFVAPPGVDVFEE